MKHIHLIILVFCSLSLNAQNTLLVYTKFPGHINFVNNNNTNISPRSIWNPDEGGMMIHVDDLENTYVTADQTINFKLSNQTRLTKLIAIDSDNKLSLHKCFTSEKYCCEKLTDKQKKGTEKLLAVSVMKKSIAGNKELRFSDKNLKQINSINDLSIEWTTGEKIKEIYLVDITELKTIWESADFSESKFTYSDLYLQDASLKKGHKYQLNIQLDATVPESGKFSFEFDFRSLAFNSTEYHFATADAVHISWRYDNKPVAISVVDSEQKLVYSDDAFSEKSLRLKDWSPIDRDKIKAGEEYTLILDADGEKYRYNFMVLLNQSESEELKDLLNF